MLTEEEEEEEDRTYQVYRIGIYMAVFESGEQTDVLMAECASHTYAGLISKVKIQVEEMSSLVRSCSIDERVSLELTFVLIQEPEYWD